MCYSYIRAYIYNGKEQDQWCIFMLQYSSKKDKKFRKLWFTNPFSIYLYDIDNRCTGLELVKSLKFFSTQQKQHKFTDWPTIGFNLINLINLKKFTWKIWRISCFRFEDTSMFLAAASIFFLFFLIVSLSVNQSIILGFTRIPYWSCLAFGRMVLLGWTAKGPRVWKILFFNHLLV